MTSSALVTVRVAEGLVAGRADGGVVSFLGIPYAAAPFGPRRFQPPQPPSAWDGTREAFAHGPAAPQPATLPFVGAAAPRAVTWGTDCLTLNIRTPDIGAVGLPVMVYVHGGGYVCGTSADPRTDGTAFARDGVVFVSLNYRLGVDGFLPLPGVPTNLGLRDQLFALRWVRENIAGFGGDPDNVTVFGNSAGAGSLGAYAGSPAAAGLFRRMILQSGPFGLVSDAALAASLISGITRELGDEPARLPLAELYTRHLALNESFRDTDRWGPTSYFFTPYMPTVDGDIVPTAEFRGRIPSSIDVLLGTTREESRLFLLPNNVLAEAGPEQVCLAGEAYSLPLPDSLPPADQLTTIITDGLFRRPAVDLARAHSDTGGRTFTYDFAWRADDLVGATHTLELPFLFDRLGAEAVRGLVGANPPWELSRVMRKAWIDFAATGDPGWGRYEGGERWVMVFDSESRTQRHPA
ncbi:carboxylesterase/lipase family protein [Nocardia sp. NPDC003482]